MLLRIDCPDCGAEYAWQTANGTMMSEGLQKQVTLYCLSCNHLGGAQATDALEAAATALDCYRIQTTAKEESA